MFAAALHGPALAGLGLLGSLAAPLLVASDRPEPWPVVVYVGSSSRRRYWLARARHWLWLALSAAAGGGLEPGRCLRRRAVSVDFYHAALACFVDPNGARGAFLAIQPHRGRTDEDRRIDAPASLAHGGLTIVGLLIFHIHDAAQAADFCWIAASPSSSRRWRCRRARAPVAAAAALAGVDRSCAAYTWPAVDTARSIDRVRVVGLGRGPRRSSAELFLGFSASSALAARGGAGKRLLDGPDLTFAPAALYAGAATLTPLGALIVADQRLAAGRRDWPIAAAAALLAALFAGAATRSSSASRQTPPQRRGSGLGALAASAIAALAAGLVFALDGGALTVSLALAALATAFVSTRLNVPALRWCVAAIGVAVAARLAWEPRIVGAALSPTPIFNWLLFGYGAPAARVRFVGAPDAQRGEDMPVRVADALAILFAAFLVFFEIRHAMNGGDPFARGTGLVEQALMTLSLARLRDRPDALRRGDGPISSSASPRWGPARSAWRSAPVRCCCASIRSSTAAPSRAGSSSMRCCSPISCPRCSPARWLCTRARGDLSGIGAAPRRWRPLLAADLPLPAARACCSTARRSASNGFHAQRTRARRLPLSRSRDRLACAGDDAALRQRSGGDCAVHRQRGDRRLRPLRF